MEEKKGGKRIQRREYDRGFRHRLLLAVIFLCTGVLVSYSLGAMAWQSDPVVENAPVAVAPLPAAESTAPPTVVPSREPTPLPASEVPAEWDFSSPAPETAAVDDDYFSDAVFLGDSRSDGLRLYGGIRGADFLAHKSLMVFQITGTGGVEKKEIPKNGTGEKKTALDWLKEKSYTKIYLMFGINELGYGNIQEFADAFSLCVDEVRDLQPDAVLYIQSLIPVAPEKAHQFNPAAWLNNDNVVAYNATLRQVCEEKKVVYVDVREVMEDQNGDLPAEGTTDGVHFTRSYYQKWYAYLKTHTADPALYFAGQQTGQQ